MRPPGNSFADATSRRLPRGGKLHACRLPRGCAALGALRESPPPRGARRAGCMCSPVALDAASACHPQPRVERRRGTMLTCCILAPRRKPPQLRALCAPVLPGRAVVPRLHARVLLRCGVPARRVECRPPPGMLQQAVAGRGSDDSAGLASGVLRPRSGLTGRCMNTRRGTRGVGHEACSHEAVLTRCVQTRCGNAL